MDAATVERINNLAKNLKDLRLASSMDEALQRAREIILGTQSEGKTLKEEFQEAGMLADTEKTAVQETAEIKEAENIVKSMADFKDAQTKDELNSLELTQETNRVTEQLTKERSELERIRREIESAKQQLEQAKNVEQRFERQTPPMQQFARPEEAPQKPKPTLSEEEKKKSDLSRIFNFGKR